MAGSLPNFHKMDSRSACIQDVLQVKVMVKGHVIRALFWILGMRYSVIDGLVIMIYTCGYCSKTSYRPYVSDRSTNRVKTLNVFKASKNYFISSHQPISSTHIYWTGNTIPYIVSFPFIRELGLSQSDRAAQLR